MKKIIYISLAGILVGSIFAIYMFSNINEKVESTFSEENVVTAFQVGVFNVYDNAVKTNEIYQNSYIYQNEDKYHVFVAIYQDEEIVNSMEEYYQNNNIEVYLKDINASHEFIDELKKYEKLLKETDDYETYMMANKNILEAFKNTI